MALPCHGGSSGDGAGEVEDVGERDDFEGVATLGPPRWVCQPVEVRMPGQQFGQVIAQCACFFRGEEDGRLDGVRNLADRCGSLCLPQRRRVSRTG